MKAHAVRAALAFGAGCVFAVLFYAAMRVGQALLTTEPNPALIVWSAHAGYFWRALIVAYAGGIAAFVGWVAAGRDPARVARFLSRGVLVAAAALALQAAFVP